MTQARTDGHVELSEHLQLVEHLIDISTGIQHLGSCMAALEMALNGISDKLGTNIERTSSVEVKTSTRGVDVSAKGYVGSDISVAGAAAVAEYFRVVDMVEAELAFRKTAA